MQKRKSFCSVNFKLQKIYYSIIDFDAVFHFTRISKLNKSRNNFAKKKREKIKSVNLKNNKKIKLNNAYKMFKGTLPLFYFNDNEIKIKLQCLLDL